MALIDIGSPAISRTSNWSVTTTSISKNNPSNASGIIDSVEIWANVALVGCKVAIFYSTGTNQFSTRAYATIGAVPAGSKQTFTGLSLACEIGDYIGIYATSGSIGWENSGSVGCWDFSGDNIPCTTTNFTLEGAVVVLSLYATGISPTDYPKALTANCTVHGSLTHSLTFLKSLIANVKVLGLIAKSLTFIKILIANVKVTVKLNKSIFKKIIANVKASPLIKKISTKTLSVAVSVTGRVSKTTSKILTTAITVSTIFKSLISLLRGTFIKITPPNGVQQTIRAFETCQTTLSATDRAGSFSLSLPAFDNSLVDAFPVGSDVRIEQDNSVFRGWVVKPPKTLNGIVRIANLEGSTYTSRTQKVIVTESYINKAIDFIVKDLFAKYVPWASVNNVQTCDKVISISFGDNYLWDAMEQLCKISTYEWYIDENLDVNFFSKLDRVNPIILRPAGFGDSVTYKKGTASFTPDASKLVNKLLVKGGKAISAPYTQDITVSTTPIPLFYTPRAPEGGSISVTIDGAIKTLGIQNIDAVGTNDFLLNVSEKLLVPDLCTSGTGTIVYCYEYPIKLLLEDKASQLKYGQFHDILKVETDDKILARELGIQYLFKYSSPVMTGTIQPMSGYYKAGELIKIEIPDLLINDYFQIKQVQNDTVAGEHMVNCTLQLETPQRDIAYILKDINARLAKIEQTINKDSGTETTVEKYSVFIDTLTVPTLVDTLTYNLHQYHICGPGLICSTTLII